MGLGIVLLFWIVVGTILTVISSCVLGGITASLTRGVEKGRRALIIAACVLPFACSGWAAVLFLFQAVVNEGLLHRDLGLGDSWHAPIPNGYEILFIDVTDCGWIYSPKTQLTPNVVSEQEDAVANVRKIQIANQYILGGVNSKGFSDFCIEDTIDSYFILDTSVGGKRVLTDYEALRVAALSLGIQPHLEPIYEVYSRNRFTWFDVLVGVLFLLPPMIAFSLLIWQIFRLRRTRRTTLLSL